VEQRDCLRSCLQIAETNAYEVNIDGKISKRNFDRLCDLHENSYSEFQKEVEKMITEFLGGEEKKQFAAKSLFSFMDSSMAFLQELIFVLDHKKRNMSSTILDTMKQFHEEIKTQTKLTWDSASEKMEDIEILNILKKLSEYYKLMKTYIKSA
jgi:hypothetical protein